MHALKSHLNPFPQVEVCALGMKNNTMGIRRVKKNQLEFGVGKGGSQEKLTKLVAFFRQQFPRRI